MRIKSVKIGGYKILNHEEMILGKDLHLFIGINGSGKSSLLEALAILFSETKAYCEGKFVEKSFSFEIEYSIFKRTGIEKTATSKNDKLEITEVILSSDRNNDLAFSMQVNGLMISSKEEMYNYLPDNLIFYYSGTCDTLERIIDKTEDSQATELNNKTSEKNIELVLKSISKNIIYIRKDYFPLLFILNYIDRDQKLPLTKKTFLLHNIRCFFQPFRFGSIKKPEKEYDNLYRLSGFLRSYLDDLIINHSSGIQYDEENNIAYFDIEYHNGILESVASMPGLSDEQKFKESKFFAFHFFSLLFQIGFLKKIAVTIIDEDKKYPIDDFSEGEQQIFVLDAIKNVLCRENSVLFLDEPDAYLHPQRQRELVPFLQETFLETDLQTIITTHSPFVTQSVEPNRILSFNKKGKAATNRQDLSSYVTIIEKLFGIDSEFNRDIEALTKKFQDLVNRILEGKDKVDERLYKLKDELNNSGKDLVFITSFEIRRLISNGIEV